jgi:PqqD family protein of HPr-rel-A system
MSPGWRRIDGVVWTKYDDSDDWVVYSPISAEVHLVNAAAHRLWNHTSSERSLSLQELVHLFAADARVLVDDAVTAATSAHLAFMEESGILAATRD